MVNGGVPFLGIREISEHWDGGQRGAIRWLKD